MDCIDGIRLDRFVPGQQYDVGAAIAAVFLAEGWAEPVSAAPPPAAIPPDQIDADADQTPANLIREIYPPYYDGPAAFAAERRRKQRSKPRST
jgi:hypothetical protein